LLKVAELEIRLCAWGLGHGRVFVDVWTEPGQWFLQPILHTSTEENYEDRIAALWWQTSAQACTVFWSFLYSSYIY